MPSPCRSSPAARPGDRIKKSKIAFAVSAPSAKASDGDVKGPVAMITLSSWPAADVDFLADERDERMRAIFPVMHSENWPRSTASAPPAGSLWHRRRS